MPFSARRWGRSLKSALAGGSTNHRSRKAGIKRLACALALVASTGAAPAGSSTWIHVDTAAATLSVMHGSEVLAAFDDISIGRGGKSHERRLNDQRTPLGEFRIVEIKEQSVYHRFFVFDYPNEARARLALQRGEIDRGTFQAIRRAIEAGEIPPQNTALGGNLGIHGLGDGDPDIHQAFNWTLGCIALTNEQIDRLMPWLHVGIRVVVD